MVNFQKKLLEMREGGLHLRPAAPELGFRGDNVNGDIEDLDPEDTRVFTLGGHKSLKRRDLSKDQAEAYYAMVQWWERSTESVPVLTLGGYAGTGKSTLVSIFAQELAGRASVSFCAYTGKAANVLRRKLIANTDLEELEWDCSTIHGLIYTTKTNPVTGEVQGFRRKSRDEIYCDLIIVDEASMVTKDIFDDLTSYGIPILAVGDHGQLPPIQGAYDLMLNPILRLEKIHRQAEGNPIIALSAAIRKGTPLWDLEFDGGVTQRFRDFPSSVDEVMNRYFSSGPESADYTAILTGYNATRTRMNLLAQDAVGLRGVGEYPISKGDRVMNLKNAHFPCGQFIANGSRGRVESVVEEGDHWLSAVIAHEEDGLRLNGRLSKYQFGQKKTFGRYDDIPFVVRKWSDVGLLFDLGYSCTVHKAQGSQFARVIVFVERLPKATDDEFRRWVYTAVTRAEQELVMVF